MADHPAKLGLACAELADAIFPHIMDRDQRGKVALALVEFSRTLVDEFKSEALTTVQLRIEALEKDSHPAIDVGAAVADMLRRNQLRVPRR